MRIIGRMRMTAPYPSPGPPRSPSARCAAGWRCPDPSRMTNRALLLAALAGGAPAYRGAGSRDTALMVDALRALGVPMRSTASGSRSARTKG